MSEIHKPQRKAAAIKRRSITAGGISSSISIEDAFWHELRRMAKDREWPVNKLIAEISYLCGGSDLSSAVRVFVLQHARQRPAVAAIGDTVFLPP